MTEITSNDQEGAPEGDSGQVPPNPGEKVSPIVGIDLGTTNSLVAVAGLGATPEARSPRCLASGGSGTLMPSVVRFDGKGHVAAVGRGALDMAPPDPARTISSVKRLMGRSAADASRDAGYLSYRVVPGPQDTARVAIPLEDGGKRVVSPQEVSAAVLRALKAQAERSLGRVVNRAVITVPAYFDDAQRQATRDAARLAGLEAVRIINEPTAAALAYGLGIRQAAGATRESTTIAVYDLGGGTFDVSILRITPGEHAGKGEDVADFFQVLSTCGDTHLGGDDMDAALVAQLTEEMRSQADCARVCFEHGASAAEATTLTPHARQTLRYAAERAKIALSTENRARIEADFGGAVFVRDISREEFERLAGALVDRTLSACVQAVRDAKVRLGEGAEGAGAIAPGLGVDAEEVSAVILVGGATRMPLVRAKVQAFFGLTPYTALNPDEVVALGAAVQASVIQQGRAAGGELRSLLLDVLPLSLGIETVGGAMAKLIVRNSTVPARASEMFSTSVDNQTAVKIRVLQGEREMAADCRLLGAFELKGIPPMPAGIPKLKVEFLVDASGVLTVRAAELRSGKALEAQVVPNHGMTREEVARIERESVTHAREDMSRHRVVDLISHSTFDVSLIERQLAKFETALDGAYVSDLRRHIASVRAMIDSAKGDWRSVDPNAFQASKESLDRASMRLHEVAIAASLKADQEPR